MEPVDITPILERMDVFLSFQAVLAGLLLGVMIVMVLAVMFK